jgi:sugar lactone lactonase YvrE
METKELPSNCGFGDADSKSLFITERGFLFRVRLDVKGALVY